MRVGVDVRHREMGMGSGGAHVLHHSLRALRHYDGDNQYLEFHRGLGRMGAGGGVLALAAAGFADLVSKHVYVPGWARAHGLDALLYFLPPCSFTEKRIPQFCYILDVPYDWESLRPRDRFYNHQLIARSCRLATRILTISNAAADAISAVHRVHPDKIRVLYPCTDLEVFRPRENVGGRVASLCGVHGRYVIGVLSSMNERKNPGAYLEVMSALPEHLRRDLQLVLVGAPRSLEEFKPFVDGGVLDRVRDHVVFTGRISDDDLATIYSGAATLLFPSKHEGFGLPVLEAHACGTGVIAADIPAVREAAAPGAFLFDPANVNAMAECLASILEGEDATGRRADGVAWAGRFSYAAYAEQMGRILAEA